MHLLDRINRWTTEAPDRPAHVSGNRVMTYRELGEASDILAEWLHTQFGPSRSSIALHGHKEPEMLIGVLAAVKSGRPYVPIDLSIPHTRVERIVENAGAAILLTPERIAEVIACGKRSGVQLPRIVGSDPFYILFTSGSTGEPKGVVITLDNLTSFVDWLTTEQQLQLAGEVFLNQAPYSFDLSVMDLYGSLATGGTLFSLTKDHVANLKLLFEALATSGVTSWVSTPSFAQMCLIERTFAEGMLPQLRRFLFCGETLAPETASQLLERFPKAEVWNTYGPTEATVATTSIQITRDILAAHNPLPVGRVMPGTEIVIRGEDGQPVAPGERGEIVIVGPNVSPGYLGRADLTERAFYTVDGVRAYRTGDWGRDKAGLIFFEGRMDGQIKLNGYRIELGDLEANLRALPAIADAVVLPVKKGERIDALTAFVVLAGAQEGSDFEVSARLKTSLAERLPAYMVPRKFRFLDAFPITANGKADRRKLSEML
jgi:D-alanine--poly(phosphoribitol) ligase subunit 1